jgi:hypothetical protein
MEQGKDAYSGKEKNSNKAINPKHVRLILIIEHNLNSCTMQGVFGWQPSQAMAHMGQFLVFG